MTPAMRDRARQRANLHLRAERAFGLDSVRVDRAPARATEPGIAIDRTADARVQAEARPSRAVTQAAATAPALFVGGVSAPVVTSPTLTSFDAPVLPTPAKIQALQVLDDTQVKGCPRCRLCETRTQTVFGEGDPDSRIFFIGEGPGENEDLSGRPFVGRAGQLLTKMIGAMGLTRERVYIANIVKCRPPGNRAPAADETAACTPYLLRQLEIVRPLVIVTLGHPAAKYMLDTKQTMGRLRGQWHAWRGIKLMPTFHPSYVLRSYTDEVRAAVWSDLKQVMSAVGLEAPRERKQDGA